MTIRADRSLEEAIIGTLIQAPHRVPTVAAIVDPRDFYTDAYRSAYRAIIQLYADDPDSVSAFTAARLVAADPRSDLDERAAQTLLNGAKVEASQTVAALARQLGEVGRDRRVALAADHLASATADQWEAARQRLAEALADTGPAAADGPLRLWTPAELAALPDPAWLVDGHLVEGKLAVLYGPSGAGKSFVAIDWALAIATGQLWHGRRTLQGGVVYIAAEGKTGLRQRIRAWQESRQPSAPLDPARFIAEAVNLLEPASAARLVAPILALGTEQPVRLVVIDTLARSMIGGDENHQRDVGLVIHHADQIRERTGAAVLIVHHTSKEGEVIRGSSALGAAADTIISVKPDGNSFTIACDKQKDGEEFADLRCHLEPTLESCVVSFGNNPDAIGPDERTILQFVHDAFGSSAVAKAKIIDAVAIKRTNAYKAIKRLEESGYIAAEQVGRGEQIRVTPTGHGLCSSGSSGFVRDSSTSRNGSYTDEGVPPPLGVAPPADEPTPAGREITELYPDPDEKEPWYNR